MRHDLPNGSHPAIQGDCQAGRIPGSPLLTIVLASGAVSARPPLPTSNSTFALGDPCRRGSPAFAEEESPSCSRCSRLSTAYRLPTTLPRSLWPRGVQPSESDHSRSSTNSRVVMPNVRTCFLTLSSPRTINKQAPPSADVHPICNRVRSLLRSLIRSLLTLRSTTAAHDRIGHSLVRQSSPLPRGCVLGSGLRPSCRYP
jgi:hypothetical protein